MPSDSCFGVSVLIAGRPVPEYVQKGRVYVESNLYTPYSFSQETEECVKGEKEVQKCPVTPYQLLIHLAPTCEASIIFIYVDGVQVTKLKLERGQSRIIRGFEDKNGIREFLFSLPRFAENEEDKLESKRRSRIGTIEVVRFEASYVRDEYRPVNDTSFNQANKKDAFKVTKGKYTMSTTKKGRYIHRSTPYDVQLKKLWRVGKESGRITINYRMGHTLKEMGLELKPIDWSRVLVRRTSGHSSTSQSPKTSESSTPVNSAPSSPAATPVNSAPSSPAATPGSPEAPTLKASSRSPCGSPATPSSPAESHSTGSSSSSSKYLSPISTPSSVAATHGNIVLFQIVEQEDIKPRISELQVSS